jgi:hypothetical protein
MPATQYGVGVGLQDMGLITGVSGFGSAGHTFQTGLVALAGGGQTGATALNKAINVVSTVATSADSCQLPPAYGGQVVYVTNAGANSMTVYGAEGRTDTINGTAGATGVALASTKNAVYFSTTGVWRVVVTA